MTRLQSLSGLAKCMVAGATLTALSCPALAQSPDDMYMLAEDTFVGGPTLMLHGFWSGPGWVLSHGGTVQSSETAIAVSGDIRTADRLGSGSRYDLNGAYLGTVYSPTGRTTVDGTTDGLRNYAGYNDMSFPAMSKQIWSYDRNWANGTMLCDLKPVLGTDEFIDGITYDRVADRFWLTVADGGASKLVSVSRGGALLSSMALGFSAGAVGMDSMGTLWMAQRASYPWLITTDVISYDPFSNQFTGSLGTAQWNPSLYHVSALEFNVEAVPEPATLAVLGVGALSLARRKRMVKP